MMKFIGILRHLISLTTIFDAVMCNDGFYPVHTQHVVGVEMDIENKVHTYLEPPSNAASCIILCSLTPDCLWAYFNTDNGDCAMSDLVCPQPVGHQESYLIAMTQNMVMSTFRAL